MSSKVAFSESQENDEFQPASSMKSTAIDAKFLFRLEDLLQFIFPSNLQHPLAAARLIIFGMYGPLDEFGQLRSGWKGVHTLMEYEVDTMCQQVEREDIMQIYLHRSRDMGLLSSSEQASLINQADAHLKKEKGNAMLPRILKQDVIDLLQDVPRDEQGRLSFHLVQRTIDEYRKQRIQQYKLVYPALATKHSSNNSNNSNNSTSTTVSSSSSSSSSMKQTNKNQQKQKQHHQQHLVSTSVAPRTMFQRMKGHTNADLIEQTTSHLSKHGFKIIDLAAGQNASITSNVKLLRDIPPSFPENPQDPRQPWNGSSVFRGAALGSMVQSLNSTTTWKRKYTTY